MQTASGWVLLSCYGTSARAVLLFASTGITEQLQTSSAAMFWQVCAFCGRSVHVLAGTCYVRFNRREELGLICRLGRGPLRSASFWQILADSGAGCKLQDCLPSPLAILTDFGRLGRGPLHSECMGGLYLADQKADSRVGLDLVNPTTQQTTCKAVEVCPFNL